MQAFPRDFRLLVAFPVEGGDPLIEFTDLTKDEYEANKRSDMTVAHQMLDANDRPLNRIGDDRPIKTQYRDTIGLCMTIQNMVGDDQTFEFDGLLKTMLLEGIKLGRQHPECWQDDDISL